MSTYVLQESGAELDRLLRAAELLSPIAVSAVGQAGLGPGGKVVDVGCGPLGALAALHSVVGPAGTVVGVDLSSGALATAEQALARLGIGGVRLVEGDVNVLAPKEVGGTDFDLAYCRLVLMHQADPAATMRRIAQLLRPGGALVAFDFFAPPRFEPASPVVDRAWELIIAAMRAKGASPDASRRYREHCAAGGFEVMSERGTFLPMPVPIALHETLVLLTGVRNGLVIAGLASADEVDALLAELSAGSGPAGLAWSPETVELIAIKRG